MEPATKADLAEVKADLAEVKVELAELKVELKTDIEQLRSEMNHGYNDLVERITDAETRLLKAFYSFAETN